MMRMQAQVDEQMQNQIEIVHASGELDSSGAWQDANGDGHFNVFVWDKNIGSDRIIAIERTSFLRSPGRLRAHSPPGGRGRRLPLLDLPLENDTAWNPTATLDITIHFAAPSGRAAGTTSRP